MRPTVYQGMYNCISRNIETELIPACRRYGLDVVVYNPIAGGLLSGKLKSPDGVPDEGRFSDQAASGALYRRRYFRESTFRAIRTIEKAAGEAGLSMVEVALRWVVHHSALNIKGGNDGILIGASSLAQLESNLGDLEKGPLPEAVLAAVDEAWSITKPEAAPYWHKDLKYGYDTKEVLFGAGSK